MNLIFLVLLGSILGLLFCVYQGKIVMKADEGEEKVKSISVKIRKGANAYLKRQYKGVAIFFVLMFLIFFSYELFWVCFNIYAFFFYYWRILIRPYRIYRNEGCNKCKFKNYYSC